MPTDHIILFDGDCNLCSTTVQFILRHDRQARFRFAAMQSPVGEMLLQRYQLVADINESFILISHSHLYRKSDAALQVVRQLNGLWSTLALLRVIPRPLRDWGYEFIARHRYRWFGTRRSCLLPSVEDRRRFLDQPPQ